jgi:CDP-diacylglycerol--glycerol-3-phosphate 3-phosphatidyltransferase
LTRAGPFGLGSPALSDPARKKPLITANMVTFARLIPMPLITWLIYYGHYWEGLVIGTLVGCTDFVDGYLARKHGPTVLGGLIDPIADKVFIAFVYLPFVQLGLFPAWAVALMFVRELMVTALRTAYALRDLQMKTSYLGKVKTWTQMQGIGLVMLFVLLEPHQGVLLGLLIAGMVAPIVALALLWIIKKRFWRSALIMSAMQAPLIALQQHGDLELTAHVMMYAVVVVTWLSGLDYVVVGLRQLRGRGDFNRADAVRLIGAITVPALLFAVLVRTDAWAWSLIAILALELAVGGLDNLLAHHRMSAGATSWSARVLTTSALLGTALMVGEQGRQATVDYLAGAAALVTLAGVAYEFWRGRVVYLDQTKRDKKLAAEAS